MATCSRKFFPALRKTRSFFSILLPASMSLWFAAPGFAVAAPQILAVAATEITLPMRCERGECAATLTTICLQEHRASPDKGTAYYLHGDNGLKIRGITPSGQSLALDHLPLDIRAARGHNMVRVSLKQTALRDYGPLRLEIAVPKHVTLVPLPIAHDPDPQSEADIALATGPLRQLADRMVDQDGGKRKAAELITQLINRLPFRGRASDQERAASRAAYESLSKTSGFSAPAKAEAEAYVKRCNDETIAGETSYRQCLGSWHDHLIGKLNTKYWKAVETGS